MMRIAHVIRRAVMTTLAGGTLAACGGDGGPTSPPGPPPPPPPPPPVGASLDLQPGEMQVLTDPAAIRRFELVGAGEAREYHVIVMSGSETEDGVTPLRFRANASGSASRVPPDGGGLRPVASRTGAAADGPAAPRPPTLEERIRSRPLHLPLMAQAEAELRRVGARPSPKRRGPAVSGSAGLSASVARGGVSVPMVNDQVVIKSAIVPGGGLTCNNSTPIASTVRAVGQKFVIIEDDASAGEFTQADFNELEIELDQFIAPVDQSYFGDPGDLDGNGRSIVFFTKEVNRLTLPQSGIIALGFFTSADLTDPVDCPSSNEAEVLWIRAPDPDGDHGFPSTVDFIKSIARSTVSHEFQHLLNASQRLIVGNGDLGDFAELWVNEGMSHVAEEVSGFVRVGVGTRANLGFDEIGIGTVQRPAFDDFQEGNLRNLQAYLSGPSEFSALARSNANLDFATRGFGYLFLRWLGDRYGPAAPADVVPGSAEHELFRELSSGGPTHMSGIQNILRAINVVSGESPTWEAVLEEYFAAPAVDDAGTSGLSPDIQFSTWDYPKLYAEMQASSVPGLSGGFPLRPTNVVMGNGASASSSFDLGASTARYFKFRATGAHPDMIVELTAPSGANVPNGARARVIVVRTG